MEETNQKNSAIWYTIGAIVLVGIAYMLFFRQPATTVPANDLNATSTAVTNVTGDVEIIINNQFSTTTIVVDKVVTKTSAWVAVHEDLGGKPGNILGASWVPMGESLNVDVELQRPATEGKTYYAIVHADDGVANFDFKTDLPLTNASGEPVMKTFQIIFEKG